MKNLFTALKDLIVSSFIFTSRTSTPTIFCPECGAMLVTKDDFETHASIGICEACFIRISDESLTECEDWYYDDAIDTIDDDLSDLDFIDCSDLPDVVDGENFCSNCGAWLGIGIDCPHCNNTDNVDWEECNHSDVMQYDPMLDKILEYYNEVSAEYCESDDLVSCPKCGKAMHIHSLQWQNIGECEACYFGQE